MFSTPLGRVVRCANALPAPSNIVSRTNPSTIGALTAPAFKPCHARRHSSSKAPCPPGSPKGADPQQGAPGANASRPTAQRDGEGRSAARLSKRKAKQNAAIALKAQDDAFSHLPMVPSTQHLQPMDVGLSSFFSLHRPISVTAVMPTASSEEAFGSIFQPRQVSNTKPGDVVNTLSGAIQSLEGFDANGDPVTQPDGAPNTPSLDNLLAQMTPFRTPPAPVPFEDEEEVMERRAAVIRQKQQARKQPAKQTAYKTTLVVTESTHADGSKTYETSTTPIVRVPLPQSSRVADPSLEHQADIRQPFLNRMRIRQITYDEYKKDRSEERKNNMLLISVKRQRKLKMKKHKYKKLMKRTRNLRRRLDRA